MAAEGTRIGSVPSDAKCSLCGDSGEQWREKAGFRILRCRGCRNAFLPAPQIPADLEALYSREYFEGDRDAGYPTYLADAPLLERNFAQRVDWLRELRAPGRLLDVGTAYGFFLAAAAKRGWDAMGVEIAPDCAEEARRMTGAPVVAGDFLEAELEGPFDVITLLDVLEHLRDPVRCLEKARSLLAPDGWLVVETGDIDTPWSRLLGNRWYFLDPPNHLHYFTATGLRLLLQRSGFAGRMRQSRMGRWVSFGNIAFKLAYGLPAGPLRRAALRAARSGLPGAVYLNFGDGLLLAAGGGRSAGAEGP